MTSKKYYYEIRAGVLRALGGKCAICGNPDLDQLTIDHINGYNGKFSPNGSRGGWRNLQDAINIIKAGKSQELRVLCKFHNYQLGGRGW